VGATKVENMEVLYYEGPHEFAHTSKYSVQTHGNRLIVLVNSYQNEKEKGKGAKALPYSLIKKKFRDC
jgi:hypothetical protein